MTHFFARQDHGQDKLMKTPMAIAVMDDEFARGLRQRLFVRTVVNLRTSFRWAWLDTKCQYRRSRIGPLWETINVAVMVGGLALVTSGLFGGSVRDLMGYIGLGMIIWSAISTLVIEGCSTFVRNAGQILSSNISIDLYVGRTVSKAFIIFVHHLALYLVGLAFGLVPLTWVSFLAIPGILLLFLNGAFVVTILAFICARYRDLELVIRNLLQLAFLVTPVFWNYQQIGAHRKFIVDYNLLFYFIQVVRMPLLGEVPSAKIYLVAAGTTLVLFFVAGVTYYRMRRRLAFFL
jgi:ABC-type polysaccharide/polyol phosphate export permease